jgi:hypothetical protein
MSQEHWRCCAAEEAVFPALSGEVCDVAEAAQGADIRKFQPVSEQDQAVARGVHGGRKLGSNTLGGRTVGGKNLAVETWNAI